MADPLHARPLRRNDLDPDPLRQFHAWFEAAREAGAAQPNAVALATATADGQPSARFVLLKSADENGFVFFTGYESRKGRELEDNPRAALCFYWHQLGRQVRVEGAVARVPIGDSDAYFASRPYGAQLSASVSRQSDVVPDRRELEESVEALKARYGEGCVPRPETWGGFGVAPELYEFWQHRDDRLHDRFRYRRPDDSSADGWTIERLAP